MKLESALALHAAGDLAGAEKGYRAVISQNSNSHVAMEKLALICLITGRVEEGSQLLSSALKLNPNNPDLYLNAAVAHKMQGRLTEAIFCNRRALELGAKYPEAHLNLGDVLHQAGKSEEAIASYEKALALRPGYAEAHNNLGVALLSQGMLEEASRCFKKAIELKPDYAHSYHNLGMALQQQGLFEEAIAPCRMAVKLLGGPEVYLNLGSALFESHYSTSSGNRLDEAVAAYRQAMQLRPDYLEAYNNLGLALREQGRLDESVATYRKAIEVSARNPAVYRNLGLVLEKQHKYNEAISCYEQALDLQSEQLASDSPVRALGRHLLALLRLPVIYRQASEIEPVRESFVASLNEATSVIAHMKRPLNEQEARALRWILFMVTNFYLSYQQLNDKELMRMYADLASEILKPEIGPYLSKINRDARTDKKIRVGVASEFLRYHHGSYWAYGWFANLPKDDYQFFFYSINGKVDAVTHKFAELGTFRWLPFREDNYLGSLKTIQEDKLDVLILTDVGMSPLSRILSLARLAPIQCAGWAHPVTTGAANIDYFLSNELMEPEKANEHYSEQLVKLSKLGLHFEYPDDTEAVGSRSDFDIPPGKVVYGTVQSVFKYLPQFDFVYPEIAKRVPNAFFAFIGSEDEHVTTIFKERLKTCFENAGFSFEERVKIVPRMSPFRFMQLLNVLDVNLDSIGWNGGFTTMRSLAMDCPVVTVPGEFMRGRHSAAMLKLIGMEELIADSPENYISLACQIGLDEQLRGAIVDKIKANKHLLFNDNDCVRSLDVFLKTKVGEIRHDLALIKG